MNHSSPPFQTEKDGRTICADPFPVDASLVTKMIGWLIRSIRSYRDLWPFLLIIIGVLAFILSAYGYFQLLPKEPMDHIIYMAIQTFALESGPVPDSKF